ncbi:MAG TPA: glycosyltransferase family 9 protein [Xanthomonadales bacterium]
MQRVLVVRIGRLGDTILATPVIEALQQALGAEVVIDFAVSPGASAYILGLDQRINRVFAIAHRSTPWRFHRVKRELEQHSREQPYDLVINLECGNECDDFVRFVHHREFCGRPLTEPRHRAERHCVDTEKSIYAGLLGQEVTAAAETSLQLKLETQALPAPPGQGHVVINPGFSGIQKPGYRSHRGWPQAHWSKLIELLNDTAGLSILVNGTADEQRYFAPLLQGAGVYSLFGSSLPTLATALLSAKVLVTVDTGTMHLAMALGTPVLALFGPTNPALTGPYSKQVPHTVLTSGVDCQPCFKTPLHKKCTFNRCMTELEPAQVLHACQRLLRD